MARATTVSGVVYGDIWLATFADVGVVDGFAPAVVDDGVEYEDEVVVDDDGDAYDEEGVVVARSVT